MSNKMQLRIKKYPMRSIYVVMEAKKQEKNLTLVFFILEACGAVAMKGYDDIEQTGLW